MSLDVYSLVTMVIQHSTHENIVQLWNEVADSRQVLIIPYDET